MEIMEPSMGSLCVRFFKARPALTTNESALSRMSQVVHLSASGPTAKT